MIDIQSHFRNIYCPPLSTPIETTAYLLKASDSNPVFAQNLYQPMIGSLMNLMTCTRPCLALSVSYLPRCSSYHLEFHHTAVKRRSRDLGGTHSMSLVDKSSPTAVFLSIVIFSDSHYSCCYNTHHSVSGNPVMCYGSLICWLCNQQQSVACSAIEARYMSIATTSRHFVWYPNIFKHLTHTIPITIIVDDACRINVAANAIYNSHTAHHDVANQFTSEHRMHKSFTLSDGLSDYNTADLMHKGYYLVTNHPYSQRLTSSS